MKQKYKVGDIVRIRKDLTLEKLYSGWSFDKKMEELKGKFVMIVEKGERHYKIKEDNERFGWVDEMFEKENVQLRLE